MAGIGGKGSCTGLLHVNVTLSLGRPWLAPCPCKFLQIACMYHVKYLFIPPKLPNRPTPEYIILELKYCRDTDPQNQYDRAISQHRPLADAIQQAAPHARIIYVPLLLGVAGTIYSSTTSHLRYLGVRKQALPRLLNRLHVMAITNLHWIYTTKRHKERHLDPQFWRHTHPPR